MKTSKELAIELAIECINLVDSRQNPNPLIEMKVSDSEIKERDKKSVELAISKVNEKLNYCKLTIEDIIYWNNIKIELQEIQINK